MVRTIARGKAECGALFEVWFLKGPVCKTSERTTNGVVVGGDGSLPLLNLYLFRSMDHHTFAGLRRQTDNPYRIKKT